MSTSIRTTLRTTTSLSAALILCGILCAGQCSNGTKEQTQFSAEDDGVKQPVTVPNEVLRILSNDERVRSELENEKITADKLLPSWFSTTQIALGSRGSTDLLVMGEGPLRGANVITFWVFVQTNSEYKLALMTRAHDVDAQRKRTHGYRNLEASAETCCTITTVEFRFDGNQYKESSEKTEDIK